MPCEFCVNQIMSNITDTPRKPENCSSSFSIGKIFARSKLTAWSEIGVASWLPCTYKPKRKMGRLYAGALNGLTTKERAYRCKCYKGQDTMESMNAHCFSENELGGI
jgi:hypothetical protein